MNRDNPWPTPRSSYGLTSNQKDFGREVIRFAGLYSGAIILATPDAEVLHSASGFLFRPGPRTFLITNAHVLKFYRDLKQEHPMLQFEFGGTVFEPSVVAERGEEEIDLAVIDVSDISFGKYRRNYWKGALKTQEIYVPGEWPLSAVKEGEAIVTVGFPKRFRVGPDDGTIEFAGFPMIGQFVGGVTETSFAVPFDREHWVSTDFDPANRVVLETALEGMSGSPVFALHRDGVVPIQLIGIVRAYGEGLDVLYCTRADLISTGGSIV
jgi:hypothetical protein